MFIPQSRMREIRWEESVRNRMLKERCKKEGKSMSDFNTFHTTCDCGAVSCLGVPIARPKEYT